MDPQDRLSVIEVDVYSLFIHLWRGKIQIILASIFLGCIFFSVSLLLPNMYRSTAVLAPSEGMSGGGMTAIANQLGGLASFAGLNLNAGGVDKSVIAIETMKARGFIVSFINRHDLLPFLFAGKNLDSVTGDIVIDGSKYDVTTKSWNSGNGESRPTETDVFEVFTEILSVEKDDQTGLIYLSIDSVSPKAAKEWVSLYIDDINSYLRDKDIADAQANVLYLKEQINNTSVAELKNVFSELLEEQMKTILLAQSTSGYAFKILDDPFLPEKKLKPRRIVFLIIGGFLGGLLSVFFITFKYVRDEIER